MRPRRRLSPSEVLASLAITWLRLSRWCLARQRETGRHLRPRETLHREVITRGVQLAHVLIVELCRVGDVERRRNEREVEVDAVALGRRVDAVKVADALGVDQRGHRSSGNVHRSALDLRPVRVQPCVAYHIERTFPRNPDGQRVLVDADGRGVSEHLRHGAAVHVHLLVALTVDFHVDHHRREAHGDGGGSHHDAHEQIQCLGSAVARDLAHVPDDGAACVDVGGADQQETSLRILGGDFAQDVRRDVLARERPQRRVVRHRVAEDARDQAALLEHVLRRDGGVDLRQRRIVLFAEKREGCDQRARADAGDELELGPRSGSRPAIEQARRVGTLVAAPGDGQENRLGQGSRLPLRCPEFLLLAERVDGDFGELAHVAAADVAHAGHARDLGSRAQLGRHGLQPFGRRRARLNEQPCGRAKDDLG